MPEIRPEAFLDSLAQHLALGEGNSEWLAISGRPALLGLTSAFRWRWFGTRLNVFIFVSSFEGPPLRHELDEYLSGATAYALAKMTGLPRGVQNGVAVIAAAVIQEGSQSAGEWVERVRGRRWAALPYPVLVDVSRLEVVEPSGRVLLGGIYHRYLRSVVDLELRRPLVALDGPGDDTERR